LLLQSLDEGRVLQLPHEINLQQINQLLEELELGKVARDMIAF